MDRRSSRGKVRLDADLKANIITENAAGFPSEDIAAKYDIHPEYVRRVVKKAMTDSQNTLAAPHEVSDPEPLIRASPRRSNKKQKTQPAGGNVSENRTPLVASVRKRKPESGLEPAETVDDVEMQDVDETVVPVPHPTRRSLAQSLAAVRSAVATGDKSCSAAPQVSQVALSPIKHRVRDSGTQTTKGAMYNQDYINFLQESHCQALSSKDLELAERSRKVASLQQQVQRLEADLKKEREKAGFERGWKKHF